MAESWAKNARRVLVCLRYGIGDVVMQLPVLGALRRSAAQARITAVGAAPAIELLDGAGLVDETVPYCRWNIRHLWDPGAGHTCSTIAGWMREAKFDLALDVAHAPPPVSHAVLTAGLPTLCADEAVLLPALKGGANGAEASARAAHSGWNLPLKPDIRPGIACSDAELEVARKLLEASGVSRPPVAFCPAASSELKRWPESCFAAVADWVAETNGLQVALFGGDLDESVAGMQRLMLHSARALVVRGLHLRRVAAVLAHCAALVCNDTGLMHMAAAVGTPVIAVFGPTSPRVYLPRGQTIGLASGPDCPHRAQGLTPPGCWSSKRCLIGPESCTNAVETETVIAALRRMLGERPRRRFPRAASSSGTPGIREGAGGPPAARLVQDAD